MHTPSWLAKHHPSLHTIQPWISSRNNDAHWRWNAVRVHVSWQGIYRDDSSSTPRHVVTICKFWLVDSTIDTFYYKISNVLGGEWLIIVGNEAHLWWWWPLSVAWSCRTIWMDRRNTFNESRVGWVERAVVVLDPMEKGIGDGKSGKGAGMSQWQ